MHLATLTSIICIRAIFWSVDRAGIVQQRYNLQMCQYLFVAYLYCTFGVNMCSNIYLNLFALPEHLCMLLTSIIVKKILTAKLLKQGYRYHRLRKVFTKFYRRHFELIEKYHVSLKKLMQQGICNPEFYGHLVYKFKKIIGNPNFSKRIVNRYERAGYSLDIMRQTSYLVFNPIMVEGYAALFSCTAVVQASDSMTASM